MADYEQKQQNLALLKSGETSIGSSLLTSTVTAPVDGTILSLNVDVGSPIASTASTDNATR